MVDLKILSLKTSWIRKLKDSNFYPWKVSANHLLSKVGGEAIFHANLSLSEKFRQRTNDLPLFYEELVLIWEKLSVCKNLIGSQINTQSLWNNTIFNQNPGVSIIILWLLRISELWAILLIERVS